MHNHDRIKARKKFQFLRVIENSFRYKKFVRKKKISHGNFE
jgi:hypothetical protein